MFDIAWSELLLIMLVALVVIGPKDLLKIVHNLGKWGRGVRAAATDFQHHIDDLIRQAELAEVRDEISKLKLTSEYEAISQATQPADPDRYLARAPASSQPLAKLNNQPDGLVDTIAAITGNDRQQILSPLVTQSGLRSYPRPQDEGFAIADVDIAFNILEQGAVKPFPNDPNTHDNTDIRSRN
jgi:Tat protein translocase TatB subunit